MRKLNYGIEYNNADATARLAHYNQWLLDPTREFGVPYPGFPADSEPVVAEKAKRTRKAPEVIVNTVAKKTKTVRAKKATGKVTNRDRVMALVRDLPYNTKAEKALVVDKIVQMLGVTKSNAAVYAYNAKRA